MSVKKQERPKSAILTEAFGDRLLKRRFSGLRSRCIIPAKWSFETPASSWRISPCALRSEKLPATIQRHASEYNFRYGRCATDGTDTNATVIGVRYCQIKWTV
eukprot:6211198-Pleurochrysis_carterae.AAC.11